MKTYSLNEMYKVILGQDNIVWWNKGNKFGKSQLNDQQFKWVELMSKGKYLNENDIEDLTVFYRLCEKIPCIISSDYYTLYHNSKYDRSALFFRNITGRNEDHIKCISEKKVMVIGLGGVGCCIIDHLSRIGVSNYVIIDFDNVKGCDKYMGLSCSEYSFESMYKGVNLHNQNNKLNSDYLDFVRYLKARKMFENINYINLGGGIDMLNDESCIEYIEKMQKIIGGEKKYFVEAGDFWSLDSTYLICKILYIKIVEKERYVFLDVVRSSQLKWSSPKYEKILSSMNAQIAERKAGKYNYKFVGCSCYQEIIAETTTEDLLNEGDILLFSNMNCYSIAWNHKFNGIEKIGVKYVEEDLP